MRNHTDLMDCPKGDVCQEDTLDEGSLRPITEVRRRKRQSMIS